MMKLNSGHICRWVWVSFGVALIALVAGCGPSGPQRYRMSGTVTFEGEPVAEGEVQFEPVQRGFGGGFAPVKDGKYDTNIDGRGHLGGEHRVQVVGFGGVVDPTNPASAAIPMFEPYKVTLDLPEKTTERDFEVPTDLKIREPEIPAANTFEE